MLKKIMIPLALSFVFSSYPAMSQEKRGEVDKVVNFVQVKKEDKNSNISWKKAETGEPVAVGNVIRTGLRSTAQIKYDDGTFTRLGSRTVMVVKDREITLKKGFLWGRVDKLLTKGLKIFTFSAVASIVGTEFFVEVEKNGGTMITVLEGQIDVKGNSGIVPVVAGTYVVIDKTGNIALPNNFKVEEVVERYKEVVNM